MSKEHAHRHVHPHPRGKSHHHAFTHRATRGRPQGTTAHEHRVWRGWIAKPLESATTGIKRVWYEVHAWWPRIGSLGIYNRRKIAGSSSWSEHAWADAWDVTDAETVNNNRYSTQMREVVAYLNSSATKARLKITRVIAGILGASDHDNHAHVDVDPDHTGQTPP